jgi:hypothetical protein
LKARAIPCLLCRQKSGTDWQTLAADRETEVVRLRAEVNRMRLALSSTNQVNFSLQTDRVAGTGYPS